MEGYITVKVGKVPGAITEVTINGGPRTVGEAVRLAGLDVAGFEVRKNGAVATDMALPVANGDTVLLLTKIKGA
jgi:hypothetical protein